jgi:hypothetical protein
VLFSNEFESGLGQWQAKTGAFLEGQIVSDPLDGTNNVLTFTTLNSAGSIVSVARFAGGGGPYVRTFDYFGLPKRNSVPGDLGRFAGVGIAAGDPCNYWLAGKQESYGDAFGTVTHLIGDSTCRT